MEAKDRGEWLEQAMARWEQEMIRLCFACLGNRALAEEAVQETFLKAWKGYERFRGAAQEKTWLTRIAVNTCRDIRRGAWFRHRRVTLSLEEVPEGAEPFTPEEDNVTRAVLRLPPKLRDVVALHCLQGFSAEETAALLGVTRSTVFARLKKARAALRKELEG